MGSPSTSISCSSTTTFALRGHLCVPQPRQLATSSCSRGYLLSVSTTSSVRKPTGAGNECSSAKLALLAGCLEQLGDCQTGEQKNDQYGQQATDGYDHAAPPAIAPPPPYHPLPAKREEAEVKEYGQAHAQHDAQHYPEQATPTQQMMPSSWPPAPSRTPRLP